MNELVAYTMSAREVEMRLRRRGDLQAIEAPPPPPPRRPGMTWKKGEPSYRSRYHHHRGPIESNSMMSIGGDEPAIIGFVPPSGVTPSASNSASRFRSTSATATEEDVANREAAAAASNAAFLRAMGPPPIIHPDQIVAADGSAAVLAGAAAMLAVALPPPPPPPTPPPVEDPPSFALLAAAQAILPALNPPLPRSDATINMPALLQPNAIIAPLSELDVDMAEMPFSGEEILPYEEDEAEASDVM